MNKKMGLMMAMGLLISAPLLSKDYLISTPRTSLLITANEGEKSKNAILWSEHHSRSDPEYL